MAEVDSVAPLTGANLLLYRLCQKLAAPHHTTPLELQPLFVRSVWSLSAASTSCSASLGVEWSLVTVGDRLEQLLISAGQLRRAARCSQLVARLRHKQYQASLYSVTAALRFLLNSSRLADQATPSAPVLITPTTAVSTGNGPLPPLANLRIDADVAPTGAADSAGGVLQTKSSVKPVSDESIASTPPSAEHQLVREVLFALRGVDGRYLRTAADCKQLQLPVNLAAGSCRQLERLLEVGRLYRRVREYSSGVAARSGAGLTARALAAAVDHQLQRFYQLLAVLETQLVTGGGLTLCRLAVWTREPRAQLRQMAWLLEQCSGSGGGGSTALSGGALASTLYASSCNGDPVLRRCVRALLAAACRPLLAMIGDWMLDGRLDDRHHELFIECDASVSDDRLWHEAYRLRVSQVPSFLSDNQARHILVAGKSVNFLRRVCGQAYEPGGSRVAAAALRRQYDRCACDALLSASSARTLAALIERVWRQTSRHVVTAMLDQFALWQHLRAVRGFLLLQRGDFVGHLLQLLAEQLSRPAASLYLHNLTGALEAAVRATSAQFEPAHVLRRVDVHVLGRSPGDLGWDVFSLNYHSDGPVRTVLSADHITSYMMLFHALWRARRLHFSLVDVWKRQSALWRRLRTHSLSSAQRLMLTVSALAAEMVHFARQLSYYTTFEVLECSWAELERRVARVRCLDGVVAAHGQFVASLCSGVLLHPSSAALLHQLRTIHNLVLEFVQQYDHVEDALSSELNQRAAYIDALAASCDAQRFGTDQQTQQTESLRRRQFAQVTVASLVSRFQTLALSYRRLVVDFLASLANHGQLALQSLCFRLDFNQHYESHEPRLSLPLTYQHARKVRLQQD